MILSTSERGPTVGLAVEELRCQSGGHRSFDLRGFPWLEIHDMIWYGMTRYDMIGRMTYDT